MSSKEVTQFVNQVIGSMGVADLLELLLDEHQAEFKQFVYDHRETLYLEK